MHGDDRNPEAWRPETAGIALGRPRALPDGPLNVPVSPASALQAGGTLGYARDGHAPWQALEEVFGALEGGHALTSGAVGGAPALTFGSRMAAPAAAIRLFDADPVVVAPEVADMDVRRALLELQ